MGEHGRKHGTPNALRKENGTSLIEKWSAVAGLTSNDPSLIDTEKRGASEFSRMQERNDLINANIMLTISFLVIKISWRLPDISKILGAANGNFTTFHGEIREESTPRLPSDRPKTKQEFSRFIFFSLRL